MASFVEATRVKVISSHKYSVDLQDDWAIGSVPHGGYVTSCFLAVTKLHFATTLASRNQPHALTLHLEFLRRTSVGPALFTIQDKKLGSQTSIVHVSLTQDKDREEVAGYVTHSNLISLEGLTLSTNWAVDPPPVAPVDLSLLGSDGEDPNWVPWVQEYPTFRKALTKYNVFVPRQGRQMMSVVDEWIRFKGDERFTNLTLGSVCDTFPLLIEGFMDEIKAQRGLSKTDKSPAFWYPTLLLNLEFKKLLPEDGVQWLFVRARAKEIKNGRNDLDITILDEHGDLVAISQHVAMVLDASRNLAARSNTQTQANSHSKI